MNFSLTKYVILSTSLALALTTLSGCGKDKEVKSNPPPTAETVPAPPPSSTDNQQNQLNQPTDQTTNPNPDNSLPLFPQTQPSPNTQGNEVLPGLPGTPKGGNRGTRGGRGGQAQLPGPTDQLPGPQQNNLPTLPKLPNREPMRAHQVDFSKAVAIKTGGQSGDGFYTSLGNDGLMEEFKSYNSKVAQQQQTFNSNLAKGIVNAKLARATGNGEISLTLSVDEYGTVQTYKMVATSAADKLNLTLSKKGTTGEMEFQGGFIKCLDLDGGCDIAYAKVKLAGAYTRIIFRNTAGDMHILIQEKILNNTAFSVLAKYATNASGMVDTNQKIDEMKLSSFEVINGRAGAGAMLTTLDQQVIGFNIPMLTSGLGSEANTSVTKNADLSKNYDLSNLTKTHSVELSRSINSVRLVKNDGRGDFKIQLQMGTEANPASIWIVVASQQKEIMSLEQIRIFESSLKAF